MTLLNTVGTFTVFFLGVGFEFSKSVKRAGVKVLLYNEKSVFLKRVGQTKEKSGGKAISWKLNWFLF